MTTPRAHHDGDTLQPLLTKLLDGELDAAGHEQLEQLVLNDEHARRRYMDVMEVHALVRWKLRWVDAVDASEEVRVDGGSPSAFGWMRWALAAAIVLAGVLTILIVNSFEDDAAGPTRPGKVTVAMLTQSRDVVWAEGSTVPQMGESIEAGQLALASGRAQLMFESGAVVDLQGPAQFEMTGTNRGTLSRGELLAWVPERASGFIIDTPAGHVVDLGTEFALRIDDDGEGSLHVFQGRVELHKPNQAVEVLGAHQAMRLDREGRWHRRQTPDPPPARQYLTLWLNAEFAASDDDGAMRRPWLNLAGGSWAMKPAISQAAPRWMPQALAGQPALRFGPDTAPLRTIPAKLGDSHTIAVVFADRADHEATGQLLNLFGPPQVVLETTGRPRRLQARHYDGRISAAELLSPPLNAGQPVVAVYRVEGSTGPSSQASSQASPQARLWINGQPCGKTTVPFALGQDSSKSIGGHPTGAAPFHGDLAELLIYDAALPDETIDQLHDHLLRHYNVESITPERPEGPSDPPLSTNPQENAR